MKILSIVYLLLVSLTAIAQKNIEKPNIIWISIEDLSPHYLPMYGNTIAKTPNLDKLAAQSVRFTSTHTAAGVCAPSRSSIITGMYPTSIGTHNMATLSWRQQTGQPPRESGDAVPVYSCVIPEQVKCFTEYLRADGYYCSNNEKQDYQFLPPVTAWDESSAAATYQNRPNNKPFFAVFNFGITHESQLIFRKDSAITVDVSKIIVPPIYPNTKIVQNDIARILTNVEIVDKQIGDLIQQLKDDGVYENTYIFFFSDHGGMLPWSKREITDRGTRIALTIKHPMASTEAL